MYNNGNSSKNVTGASVVDGTIANADIDSSAAIATSKLSGAVTSITSHGLASSATTDTTNASNIGSGTLSNDRLSLDISNSDVNASAAIAQSKLATLVITDSEVADDELSGNKIDGGVISNFQSTGIDDRLPTDTVLTLSDTEATFAGDVVSSKTATPVHELHSLKDGVGDAEVIGSFQVYGSDGSSGGVGLRTKIETISENSVGNAYSVVVSTSSGNAAPTEKVRFPAAGGITFNGDTAAANALDDYEEGSWTPTDTSGAGLSLTIGTTDYIKIGKQVTCFAAITYPSTADATALRIGGLPFSAGTFCTGVTGYCVAGFQLFIRAAGGTQIIPVKEDNSSPTNANLSTKYFQLHLTYEVD